MLQLAAGLEWDGLQYLPKDWTPFSPIRWLADWLQQRIDGAKPLRWPATGQLEEVRHFSELCRADKIALAFEYLDRAKAGWVAHMLLIVELCVRGDSQCLLCTAT